MSRVTQTMSKMSLARSLQAPTKNADGYPAWNRSPEEAYVQMLLTNTIGQTYYASAHDLLAEAQTLHGKMAARDPSFMSKAIRYARNHGYMRTQPTLGLAYLSRVPGPHFEQAFDGVIRTPKDLSDFTVIVKTLAQGEGGRRVKRAAGRWLATNLSEYWAIKYGADKDDGGYSLKDMLQVYHPKFSESSAIVDYLMDRTDLTFAPAKGRVQPGLFDLLPQIACFEALKRAKDDEVKVELITGGRIPHEQATPHAGSSQKVWEAIVAQMPAFALLKNLATIERHGVVEASREHILSKLSAPALAKANILPYRFLKAMEKVQTPWIRDALRDAVDYSFAALPDIEGRTAVMLDRSGSMNGDYMTTGSLFGVCLMRKAKLNGRFMLFDDRLEEFKVSMRDSVLTQAERIQARGGTNTALPITKLLADKDKVDNIILITDEQQNAGTSFLDVLDKYRNRVNGNVKTFVIDLAPYAGALSPADPLTYYIFGWSDQVLQFISMASRGWSSITEVIRSGAFDAPAVEA